MKEIKKIMVPLAFSPYSQGIVEYSVLLGRSLDIDQLLFVNVIDERDVETVERITALGYEVDGEHYIGKIQEQRSEALEKMLEHVDFPREKIRLVITVGRPATKLLQYAVREDVDMIVMGVKARGEIAHAFTGSVAEKLFRRSPVTIVSYRDDKLAERLRNRITV